MQDGWLGRAITEIANGLVEHLDVDGAWIVLCEQLGQLLDRADVGVVVADHDGGTELVAASTERLRPVERHEVLWREGPAHDSLAFGGPVLDVSADRWDRRWPNVGPRARDAGYRTAHAFPLRRRDELIGAVSCFSTRARPLDRCTAELAQTLTDVTTICIVQARQRQRDVALIAQLQRALESRLVIEQAKGIVAHGLGVEIEAAFVLIRKYARHNNARLHDVASDIVTRRLEVTTLLPPPERRSGASPASH